MLPRGGYYAAWHNGGLLLAGGTYWEDKKKYWTDRVSFYEPRRGEWVELNPLPRKLAYGVMAKAAGSLYLIGGTDEKVLCNDIYRLQGETWQRTGSAPIGVIYASAVTVGHRIYVMGGSMSDTDLTKATNQAWSYDVTSDEWEKLELVPGPPRIVHAATASGKSIYLFGGLTQAPDEPYKNLGDAYCFDTVTKKWTAIEPLPEATRALWASSIGGYVYLFGGHSATPLDAVNCYDPVRGKYRSVSRLPLPLMDTKFFYDHGNIYGASGEDKPGSRFVGLMVGRLTSQIQKPSSFDFNFRSCGYV